MKKLFWLILPLLLGLVVLSAGCGKTNLPANITAYNSSLQTTDRLNILDTLLVGITGLRPHEQYNVSVIEVSTNNTLTTGRFTADENGVIPPVGLWYNIGAVVTTEAGSTLAEGDIDTGLTVKSFRIRVAGVTDTGTDMTLPFVIINDTAIPIAWASDSAGKVKHAFDVGTPVYAYGKNFAANKAVDLYVTIDRNWTFGDTLAGFDVTSTVESATTDSAGVLPASQVWASAAFQSGFLPARPDPFLYSYDIVVDVNQNGSYDAGDVVDHIAYTGFVVQTPPVQEIKLQVASTGYNYPMYNAHDWGYADTIKRDGSTLIYAGGTRGIRAIWNPYCSGAVALPTSIYGRTVDVYITATAPTDGLAIPADVSGPGSAAQVERLPVYPSCYNGCGQYIIWPQQLLRNGSYYVVVDVNLDGIYTKGTDIIDGVNVDGSAVGFKIVD